MLVQNPQKIDTAPIFGVSRINAKLWHCSRDLKIGLVSIFSIPHTNGRYVPVLYNKILDCLRNLGAELTLFHILHANPWARKTYPKIAYVLRAHGFGCQIRNTGSLAPILRWQSWLGAPRGEGYRLLASDQIKKVLMKFSNLIYIFFKNDF